MTVVERFLKYVSFDTQSDEDSVTVPSSAKQKVLGAELAAELSQMGLHGVRMDEYGYVYGWLPATAGCEGVPCLGLIAHMDTSPDAPGAHVQARIVRYEGGVLVQNAEQGISMSPEEYESLRSYAGQDLIVTDGTTLLGADDKAGVAEIFTALEYLTAHPERPHGRIAGELEYENFNAASATVTVHGLNIHPGSAKNKMKNAALMAVELVNMLPPAETPAHTEGYEGFYHLQKMEGDIAHARLSYIIRDHDRTCFEARKAFLGEVRDRLNAQYGPDTVRLTVRDSYFNMKEQILPHMELIDKAREAMEEEGITPLAVPVRGGTDGARLSYMGLPCPNLCCGALNTHGPYEYCSIQDMEKIVAMLIRLVQKFGGKNGREA